MKWTLLHVWPVSRKYCIIGHHDTELLAFRHAKVKELSVVAVLQDKLSAETQVHLWCLGRDAAEYEVYDQSIDDHVMLDVAWVGRRTL